MTKREPVRREERIDPTPETLSKLRPDVIQYLFDKGLIGPEHTDAASEIRTIYFAVIGGLFCRAADHNRVRGRGEIPERLADHHAKRYLPWTRAMGRFRLPIVMDAVIDNRLFWQQRDTVIDGLTDYVSRMVPSRGTISIDRATGMLDYGG